MNWEQVNLLLSVMHQAAAAGPKYAKWASLAADELEKLWGVPPSEPDVQPEDVPEEKPSNGMRRL